VRETRESGGGRLAPDADSSTRRRFYRGPCPSSVLFAKGLKKNDYCTSRPAVWVSWSPSTLYPEPKTPNPKPQTPEPQTPNPKPPNPKPQIPHPKPRTPNPKPHTAARAGPIARAGRSGSCLRSAGRSGSCLRSARVRSGICPRSARALHAG